MGTFFYYKSVWRVRGFLVCREPGEMTKESYVIPSTGMSTFLGVVFYTLSGIFCNFATVLVMM